MWPEKRRGDVELWLWVGGAVEATAFVWSALTVVVHEHRHVIVVVAKRVFQLISDEPHAGKAAHLPPCAHARKRLRFVSRLAGGGARRQCKRREKGEGLWWRTTTPAAKMDMATWPM